MKKLIRIHLSKGLVVLMAFFVWGCEKFVVVDPPITSLTGNTVFEDETTATAAIMNVYHDISFAYYRPFQGEQSLSWMSGLMADEYNSYFTDNRAEFANHQITPQNLIVRTNWAALYEDIYRVNIILEQMSISEKLSTSFRERLEGEARFLRALMYFYLVNFWENVPLILTTDYMQNKTLPQSDKEKIYAQIVEDLTVARELLGKHSLTNSKTRPNYYTASALLAKVFLQTQQWAKAIEAASVSINSGVYELEGDLDKVFLNNSKEVIWNIIPITPSIQTWDGFRFILRSTPTAVTVSDSLLEAFEIGDIRKANWIGTFNVNGNNYHYPYKYKVRLTTEHAEPLPEYFVMFRLSEQYLIRAEANIILGNLSEGVIDLNKIRNRAGLPSFEPQNSEKLLEMVHQERRVEFFAEGSIRWFDLKRLGLTRTKFLPIPENELLYNPALIQNSGY